MDNIEEILEQRGKVYGEFIDNATTSQSLKKIVTSHKKWDELAEDQKEAIEIIIQKISRILSGNPDYIDNWIDISGYAKLVSDKLEKRDGKS